MSTKLHRLLNCFYEDNPIFFIGLCSIESESIAYEVCDFLKKLVEDDQSLDEIVSEGFDLNDVKKISMLLSRSEYKRFQSAPGPKVTEKAFGRDRRYPLTSGFRNWN